MRDLLSVEILCYTANHGHLKPTAKALQIFGRGHLGLNTSSGIRHYRCSLRIESWIMALIHEPEVGLKHHFPKRNIFNHCSTPERGDLRFDSANISHHWSSIGAQRIFRSIQSPASQFSFHSFFFKKGPIMKRKERETGAAYSLSVQT